MAVRALLFDLDNTLYPASSGVMQQIDQRIALYVKQRLGLPDVEVAAIKRHYYSTYGTTLRGLLQNHAGVETEDYLAFVHDVPVETLLRVDEALRTMLEQLVVPKVIFTNSPREHAERVLGVLGLADVFDRVYDLRYFDFHAKPNPDCYVHILEQLAVRAEEALLIEDTPHNLGPARALGIATILICPADVTCADADFHVRDIRTALEIAEHMIVATDADVERVNGQLRPAA